ncbi:MAG: UbiX family flavin prenyltransferase [Streptosporangiales bacterium]|nr:UbiX family flavin prenyltransferase [Streptosporangiales bacterium]
MTTGGTTSAKQRSRPQARQSPERRWHNDPRAERFSSEHPARRVVVGITGATGAIFGIRVLEQLGDLGVETHVCISHWGERNIEHETGRRASDVRALASAAYPAGDLAAIPSSGSFRTDGMVIAPCSMRTVAAIASGLSDNLITRCADVALKESRKLILMTRETPLNEIHLTNMLKLAQMGVTIMPPVPAFYNHPQTIDDVVDHIVGRALDQLGLDSPAVRRWSGELLRHRPLQTPVDQAR